MTDVQPIEVAPRHRKSVARQNSTPVFFRISRREVEDA
jgi:hypothetical protein